MNKLVLVAALLMSGTVSAGLVEVRESVNSTFALIGLNHSLDEVEAISATMGTNEVETKALLADERSGHEEVLSFGCHAHGPHMACHPEGHAHLKEMPFSEFLQGVNAAFTAIEKSFSIRGISGNSLEEVKFWKSGHSHFIEKSSEEEVWAKFTYEVGGTDQVVFSECHRHTPTDPYDCHFQFSGEGEPDLGSGHQH